MKTTERKPTAKTGKSKSCGTEAPLREIRDDVAGIDIGALEEYVSCRPNPDGSPNVKVFPTDTESLNELADWLAASGVHSVAMESTGVYWIPLYQILVAREIEVVLVDARSLKGVPGRKTDVIDCQWLRQLHACGLLKGCFLPDDPTASLRALLRMRQTLRREQDDWIRRLQKQLEMMNVRVHRAVSDITGVTGMAIVRAIVAGERNPVVLARLRDRRCRKSEAEIARELTGDWRDEHLFNLTLAVETYDHFAAEIAKVDQRITTFLSQLKAKREAEGKPTCTTAPAHPSPRKRARFIERGEEPLRKSLIETFGIDLTQIDGIGVETAAGIFMELGPDVPTHFPTEGKFAAYLRLAPNIGISGGHPVRSKKAPRRGMPPLKRLLLTAAATMRISETPLGDYYRKTAFRRGAGIAIFATAGKIARRIYRALAFGVEYAIGGDEKWRQANKERQIARLSRLAASLGHTLVPAEA
jgi:transposase